MVLHDGEAKLRASLVDAGERAQFGEEAGERLLCFIDDEDGAREGRGEVIGPACAIRRCDPTTACCVSG